MAATPRYNRPVVRMFRSLWLRAPRDSAVKTPPAGASVAILPVGGGMRNNVNSAVWPRLTLAAGNPIESRYRATRGRSAMFAGKSLIFAGFAATLAVTSPALAQDFYRGKTVTIVVGYSAGGGYDQYARLVAGGGYDQYARLVARNLG